MEIELKDCFVCGKKKSAIHELWTPDGTYWGDYCSDCYNYVMKSVELWWYHGLPIPDFLINKRSEE